MSSTTTLKDPTPSFGDPYDILHVLPSATNAEITKAYRKLALQLHPDKQSGKSENAKADVNKEFHKLQQARNFLLEAEFSDQKRIYDQQRESNRRRQQDTQKREASMSERRKAMRDELKRKEELSNIDKGAVNRNIRRNQRQEEEVLNNLRKEGKRRRQEYAERTSSAADIELSRKRRLDQKALLEARQVRLKWSRKRLSKSPSEHSLAEILEKFGTIEGVELIGGKGNAALITFSNPTSCKQCVDFYRFSEEMRASYVGKRKEDQDEVDEHEEVPTVTLNRDGENLRERQARQLAEREKILREMEENDEGLAGKRADITVPLREKSKNNFPLQFPANRDFHALSTPLEKLQHMERLVFGDSTVQAWENAVH